MTGPATTPPPRAHGTSGTGPRAARPGAGLPPGWRDALVLALRAHDVPGPRIGEILAECDDHCATSGQTPVEAFGEPADYAAARAAAEQAPTRPETLRTVLGVMPSVLGLLLVVACAGTGAVPVTVGWLAGVVLFPLAAVLVVRVVEVGAATGRGRRAGVVAWATLTLTLAAAVALVLLLDDAVLTLDRAVALTLGVVLLLVPAVMGTRKALRAPDADLVTGPWEDAGDARRRNVRADVLAVWLLPALALVGYAGAGVLAAALPAAS